MERKSPFAPVRRCSGFQRSLCHPVADETDPRPASFAFWAKGSYGLNVFGLSTTGKYNCHQRMRMLGGDTFVFWPKGRCEVWRCSSIQNESLPSDREVWSHHCNQTGQNHIIAHLFEWPWKDVET